MNIDDLIAECTAYDFKAMLEEKKPKSWLKSVSAFANGTGGSLFFGVENDRQICGLDNVQRVCESISSFMRDRLDPLPETDLKPIEIDGKHIVELKVFQGKYTPYYYMGDNQRIAFIRIGNESVPATDEQMLRLVLKGANRTFDSLHTSYPKVEHSFSILANTFKKRTTLAWNPKFLKSFGLVTDDGMLTNAGALFAVDERTNTNMPSVLYSKHL